MEKEKTEDQINPIKEEVSQKEEAVEPVIDAEKKSVEEKDPEEKIIESSIPSLIIVVLCVIGIIFISRITGNKNFKSV